MTEYARDYTLEEQLASRIAKVFKPDDELLVSGVSYCTTAATYLAKKLRAPGLAVWAPAGGRGSIISPRFLPVSPREIDAEAVERRVPMKELLSVVNAGRWCIFMTPAQIDKFGNTNISLIGDIKNPKAVLVASRGLPDNTTNARNIYYHVPRHSTRVFVDKVDFISGVGYVSIRKRGEVKFGAVSLVFSDLGVFGFDEETKRMCLQSVHHGVTVEQVMQNTGFELAIPEQVPETEPPTEEEVRLIREEIDPLGLRRLDHAGGPEAPALWADIRQREKDLLLGKS
ncbi:CoA-transferase [Chloroflexota bacterium]